MDGRVFDKGNPGLFFAALGQLLRGAGLLGRLGFPWRNVGAPWRNTPYPENLRMPDSTGAPTHSDSPRSPESRLLYPPSAHARCLLAGLSRRAANPPLGRQVYPLAPANKNEPGARSHRGWEALAA